MSTDIKLTIAIPTYKRPKYLEQAIDSVVNQRSKGLACELIVVNNDPEADMTQIKEKYAHHSEIRFFVNERNIGMLGNVNRCVEYANGEYVAFLHDDDLLLPGYLEEVEKLIENDKYACIIPERYLLFEREHANQEFDIEMRRKKKEKVRAFLASRWNQSKDVTEIRVEDNVFAWQNCYCAPTCGVVFRKRELLQEGLFFPEGTYSWDFYSFLALNKKAQVCILHKPLAVYRMTTGLSLKPEVQYDFYKSFEDMLVQTYSDAKANVFIQKYAQELHHMNYQYLSEEGRVYTKLQQPDAGICKPSKYRYMMLKLRRIIYYATRHLEVERVLTSEGEKILQEMGIISGGV